MQYAINEEHLRKAPPSMTQITFVWFQRMVALICLFYGASYWMKLIGIQDGPLSRYDLMPVHWQIAATSLAVLYPVAATGLWMVVSWGAVIWGAVAITETIMYAVFPEFYGSNAMLLVAHGATAFLYVAFRLALLRENRLNQI